MKDWFFVGAKLWFMGFGLETEVISYDESKNYWIGEDIDSQRCYPLNEVEKYWKNTRIPQ